MIRRNRPKRPSGSTILVVDDNADYLEAARLILEREGHQVFTATNGMDALAALRERPVDLLLLDYYMPGMTGEEVVIQLRRFNPLLQIILQTGYAGEQPPRELLKRLDIQGYYDKSEGPDKLLLWVDIGLKAAYTVQLLHKSRQGLKYILDITPELHKIQPLDTLLQGVLSQITGLLGAVHSFLAMPAGSLLQKPPLETGKAESFLAMFEDDGELIVHAGTGRFAPRMRVHECLTAKEIDLIRRMLQQSDIQIVDSLTVIPLRVGEQTMGLIYMDMAAMQDRDRELVQVFANQAAVAIHNAQLYEMAALDPLTSVYVRRFFGQYMQRELRTAFRSRQPSALLMLDMDQLKHINDLAGHVAGDQALTTMGRVLHRATRDSDIVGRYGGDEFAIMLLQTEAVGAEAVAERILSALREQTYPFAAALESPPVIGASIGIVVLQPHAFQLAELPRPISPAFFQYMAYLLIQKADEALYAAKRAGGNCFRMGQEVQWVLPNQVPNDYASADN